ncbi:MAG: GNAT family N-acetyltransferase, partial [Anaerolineae bacterium]|nr:GNAT family N-acetyltransferase [Anaerolineae bacterium]
MITIRPFDYSDADYKRAVAINAAVFNDSLDMIGEWQHDDQVRSKEYPFYRDMVLRDGFEIAYVETFQNQFAYHPQKYTCYIFVDPAHDAPDVRPVIWKYILKKLAGEKLIGIMSGMLDDKAEAMRFFADFGFERVAEEKLSKLDVTRFNALNHEAALAQVRASGIEIVSLRNLQEQDSDWQQKLYDLDVTVNRDIPSVGEKHYPDHADWVKMRLESPNFDPDAWFVALDTDKFVGQSQGSINRESQPVQFMTGVTTVRREYRRRGIAT